MLEFPILKRERSGGLSIGAYVASKVVVLLPLLACVGLALFAVLRGLDRLPDAGGDVWMALALAFLLDAAAGMALGRILDLPAWFGGDPTPLGGWAPAFTGSAMPPLLALVAMVVVCVGGTIIVLGRRLAPR